ncbi:MAG: hypothetical protein M1275_04025 [Patescibacteria group bacterium]|nr:hypothetical protein [Patescibacteria group bacterium]
MIVEKLRQFGLDEKEIPVYLALISLGPSPASVIAGKSGVNRGTTYDILKKLHEQQLVSVHDEYRRDGKITKFTAEPPEKIVNAIERRIADLADLKDTMEKSLPEFQSLYEKGGAKPVVKYYEGLSGVRFILQDVIATMSRQTAPTPSPGLRPPSPAEGEGGIRKYFVYSSPDIRDSLYKAYSNFNKDRIKSKIANQVIAFGKGGELAGLDERKWMPGQNSSPTYILIYGGKVAMISIAESREPVGVIIEDTALYQTQKMIFEHTWKNLK